MSEIEQLKEKLLIILDKNKHWKSCQDGSYEQSLSVDGYWKIKERIAELEGEL